jgi:4-amino-4-deoxy-L-arabinose transferase-like glycosyltransferase
MNYFNKDQFNITLILILSLLVGTVAILVLPDFKMLDAASYDFMGLKLLNDQEYVKVGPLEHIIPPGYPFFLAAVYGLFGHNYDVVFLLQFLLVGGVGVLLYLIGRNHLDLKKWQALLAALIVVVWPYMALFAKQLLTEILFIFFLIYAVFEILNFYKLPSWKRGAWAATLLAFATLTRAVTILLPIWIVLVFVFIRLVFKRRFALDAILKAALISVVVFGLVIAPWIGYASYRKGEFIPVASNLKIMNEKVNKRFEKEWLIYKTPGYEPGAEITLQKKVVSKLKNIYRFWESGGDGQRAEQLTNSFPPAKYLLLVYSIGFYIILGLAFLSLFFVTKKRAILALWIILLYFWSVHIALYPYPRYTLPIIPIVIILAAYSFFNFNHIIKKITYTLLSYLISFLVFYFLFKIIWDNFQVIKDYEFDINLWYLRIAIILAGGKIIALIPR